MGHPHCLVVNAGCKEAGEKTKVESVQSHDHCAHPDQLQYQPVRHLESTRRSRAQDYPNRSPKDDISTQLELFPQKEGSNFENYKTNAYLQAVKQQN